MDALLLIGLGVVLLGLLNRRRQGDSPLRTAALIVVGIVLLGMAVRHVAGFTGLLGSGLLLFLVCAGLWLMVRGLFRR